MACLQGGQQSSATDQSLETAQQNAWQLFAQGSGPMHMVQEGSKNVPQIDYGYDNATSEGTASVMLSHNLNGGDRDPSQSQMSDDKQMNR